MGKGKGMLERAVIRIKKNFSIFEFKGFSKYRLNKLVLNANKKLNLGLYLYCDKKINYSL
jgi:ribosomal protein L16/L10AE